LAPCVPDRVVAGGDVQSLALRSPRQDGAQVLTRCRHRPHHHVGVGPGHAGAYGRRMGAHRAGRGAGRQRRGGRHRERPCQRPHGSHRRARRGAEHRTCPTGSDRGRHGRPDEGRTRDRRYGARRHALRARHHTKSDLHRRRVAGRPHCEVGRRLETAGTVTKLRGAALALTCAIATACTATHAGLALAPASAASTLTADLDALFETPPFDTALWSARVETLDMYGAAPPRVLYERNARSLVMPASNMKIVTMAAAAELLGWDHRFETTLAIEGDVRDGVLHGDVHVIGGGDPSISPSRSGQVEAFDAWI